MKNLDAGTLTDKRLGNDAGRAPSDPGVRPLNGKTSALHPTVQTDSRLSGSMSTGTMDAKNIERVKLLPHRNQSMKRM
jgi:hypothetical protein